jgi:hypothetical protein
MLFNNLTADESTLGYVHLNQAMMLPINGALSGDTVARRLEDACHVVLPAL